MLAGTEATQLLKPGGEVIFEVARCGDWFRASICTDVWPNTLVRDDDAMQRRESPFNYFDGCKVTFDFFKALRRARRLLSWLDGSSSIAGHGVTGERRSSKEHV